MATTKQLNNQLNSFKIRDKTLRILHLEDSPGDALLISNTLKKGKIIYEGLVVDSKDKFIKALKEFSPDVILADHSLPSFNSDEALNIFHKTGMKIPFILITAAMSEEFAVGMIKKGADDYILKDRLHRLPVAIQNSLEKFRLEKERQNYLDELINNEHRFRGLIENSADGMAILSAEGKHLYVSPSIKNVLGYSMEEGMQTDPLAITHPEDIPSLLEMMKQAMENPGAPVKGNAKRLLHKNGTWLWVEGILTNMLHDPAINGIIYNFRDITESKLAEEVLKEIEEKNALEREILIRELTHSIKDLKQFTYITSHNFKAPLSNLIGLLNHVDFNTLSSDNKSIVEMFKTSTLQLNKTIDDLVRILIVKNNVNVNIFKNDINEILDTVVASLQYEIDETGCTINKKLQVADIHFNKSYLESILLNLISNAIKYRSPRRPLTIDIATERAPNEEVLLTIKDNGVGIDLIQNQDRIFGLYQRFHSNPDGVGLGLYMVKSQLNALGARIDVESEVDKGTAFFITFKEKIT